MLFGDADTMHGHSHGGNDTLIGVGLRDQLYGDAYGMYDHATGGDDHLVLGSIRVLFGDAHECSAMRAAVTIRWRAPRARS